MDLFARFDAEKLRLNLKLSAARLEMNRNKRVNDMERQKKDIAALLKDPNKEELARIRTEHFVRDDRTAEVYAILNLMCVLTMERTKMLAPLTDIPYDMRETIASLVYAADKVDIPELLVVKKQFMLKFGKALVALLDSEAAQRENVNERVYEKLSVKPPSSLIVTAYMKEIAKEKGVNWIPSVQESAAAWEQPMPAPKGTAVTGMFGNLNPSPQDFMYAPPPPASLSFSSSSRPPTSAAFSPHNGAAGDDEWIPPQLPSVPSGKPGAASGAPPPPAPPKRTSSMGAPPPSVNLSTHFPGMDDVPDLPSDVFRGEEASERRAPPPPPSGGDAHVQQRVTSGANSIPDFEELSRRFEALKRG